MVDNHEAVEVGDIEKKLVSKPVVRPKFTTQFPEAVVREGADEVTLREEEEEEEEGILHRYHECERQQMEATARGCGLARKCQAIFEGVEGSEWEAMYYKKKELQQAVKFKKSEENKNAKALWALKEAKDKGVAFYALGSRSKSSSAASFLGNPFTELNGGFERCPKAYTRRTRKCLRAGDCRSW